MTTISLINFYGNLYSLSPALSVKISAPAQKLPEPTPQESLSSEIDEILKKLIILRKSAFSTAPGRQKVALELRTVMGKIVTQIHSPVLGPEEKVKLAANLITLNEACRASNFWLNGFDNFSEIEKLYKPVTVPIGIRKSQKEKVILTDFPSLMNNNFLGIRKFFDLEENKKFKDLCATNTGLIFFVPDLEKYIPDLKAPDYVGTNDELTATIILDTFHENYKKNHPGFIIAATLVKEAAMVEFFRKKFLSYKSFDDFFEASEKYSYLKEKEFLNIVLKRKNEIFLTELEITQIKAQINFIKNFKIAKFL